MTRYRLLKSANAWVLAIAVVPAKAKLHYASWFGASSELAPSMFGASSEPASVIGFGFKQRVAYYWRNQLPLAFRTAIFTSAAPIRRRLQWGAKDFILGCKFN